MDSALKGLMLAAGVILTCVVIGVGFYVAREAKSTAMSSTQRLSEFKKEISENSITKYDDTEVSGSDVVNFAKKMLGTYEADEVAPVYVRIETSKHSESYENDTYVKALRDVTNIRYVSPLKLYVSDVIRDDNDVITGVVFVEK